MKVKSEELFGKMSLNNRKYLKRCAACGLSSDQVSSLHKMPKNKLLRDLWCAAFNTDLYSSSKICNNHFKKSDYRDGVRNSMLNRGAVPSLQLHRCLTSVQNRVYKKNLNKPDSEEKSDESTKLSFKDKLMADFDSKNYLSTPEKSNVNIKSENSNTEEELCYIYYLDEKQNVSVVECSTSNDCPPYLGGSSSVLNKIRNPSSIGIERENSSNLDFDAAQSIRYSSTED